MKFKHKRLENGFTIVELMIALTVFSTILIIASSVMIQISRVYSKGVNAANTQNIDRNLLNDVSSTLQFSSSDPISCATSTPLTSPCYANQRDYTGDPSTNPYANKIYAICISTTRYSFVLNRELGQDIDGVNTPHVMWRDNLDNANTCQPLDISTDTVSADSYSVDTNGQPSSGSEILGDKMRLSQFRVAEISNGSGVFAVDTGVIFGDTDLLKTDQSGCKGGAGGQYCASSILSQTVTRRY